MKRILTCLSLAAIAAAAAGQAAADDVKIGYINKMGDHPWFVAEVAGAKAAAEAAGAAFVSQDVQFNADLTVTTFDTMVGDGVKGIAIVVPDKGLGPVIAEKAKKAGITLVAVDDDIYFAGRRAGALCRHERAAISGPQSARSSPSSTRPRAGPTRKCASPRSRTARPTPACSATRAPRRRSSRRCRTSSRRTSSASPTTTPWSTRST